MSKFQDHIKGNTPVLVDFHADWCGPCKTLAPIIKEVKAHFGTALVVLKVDVDKNKAIATNLNIRGVPTMILYKKGKQLWRQSGVVPASQLISTIEQKAGIS